MKIKIETNEFKKAISKVNTVITSRELNSVYASLLLKTSEDKIFITATDMETTIRNYLNADVIEPGSICIRSKDLSNIINNINFESILLEVKKTENYHETVITDTHKKYKYEAKINGEESSEEFLSIIPDYKVDNFAEFDSELFKEPLDKVSYSIGKDDTRHIFNGLFINKKEDKIVFVGTDGRRLCKSEKVFNSDINFGNGLIVPHKAIYELKKIVNENSKGYIGVIEDQLFIKSGNTEILCKLIEGKYPNYDDVIPKSNDKSVLIPKFDLELALKQSLATTEEPGKQVIFTFSNNLLNVFSQNPGISETNIDIDIIYDKEEIKIGFKGEYLSDIFRCIQDDFIQIDMKDNTNPVLFLDKADPGFLSVVAPMKIKN